MKIRTGSIVVMLLFLNAAYSQIDTILWQNCLGTEDGFNQPYAVEQLNDGYLFGIDLEKDGPGVTNYHGISDAWIVNTDYTGTIKWEKCYGGSQGDGPQKILKVNDTSFYLINHTNSNDGDVQNGRGGNFWIVKIDTLGNIIWENSYGGSINGELVRDAILLPDNGLLMMGRISSTGGDITTHYGNMDIWLCRIDSVGNIIWQKTIGNTGRDNGIKIKLSSHNTILFIGGHEITGGMIDCPDLGYYIDTDVWFVEMDMKGNFINQWCYGGKYYDLGYDIIEVEEGYVIAASTRSNDRDVSGFHGDPGGDYSDIWAFKIDIYGNLLWQRCLGGLTYEWPVYLTQTADSGYIIIGNAGSLDGDVTGNHSLISAYSDIWVIKLTGAGELQWNHCFGGLSTERFWDVHSVLKKDDYNYVIGANANYLSDDVECDLFPNDLQNNAWLLEVKDCDYYKPHVPVITSGPDTVCSTVTASSVYDIDTAKWATGYEWLLIPETAGTISIDSLSAQITWNLTYEGTAELKARGTNDCGESEWSEARCIRVHTCLGIEEDGKNVGREDGRKGGLEIWPNPARGIVDCRWSIVDFRGDLSLMIYDIFWGEIQKIDVPDTDHEIKLTVEDLLPGLYLVVVKDENNIIGSAKMVISR
jgi:hypothetical protein